MKHSHLVIPAMRHPNDSNFIIPRYNAPMPTLHHMAGSQLPTVLALLAQSGGTARTADSWNHDHMTALLLGDKPDAPTAIMPISQRPITLSPNCTLNVGWLSSNQFAAKMSHRRQTKSTAPDWPALLPELDALLVVRRDEASLSGRWYAQTGFHDVLSIRCLYRDMTTPPAPVGPAAPPRYHPQIVSVNGSDSVNTWEPALWQPEMLAVYRDVYSATGGAPPRHENFWQNTLAHHYYREHYQFQIIGLWSVPSAAGLRTQDSGLRTLLGYALIGWSGWHSKRPRMDILELATRQWDAAAAAELLQTTCQLAWSKNVRQVRAVISAHDPYRGLLARSGFIDRWGYQMLAKWLNPQRHLDRLGESLPPEIADLTVHLSAPGHPPLAPLTLAPHTKSGIAIETSPASDAFTAFMQGRIHLPSSNPPLTLQADPRTLTRLLLGRLDIAAALQDGTLFTPSHTPLSDADQARLSVAFPWTPWVFHMLDYI